jgi:hypothetical protein
MSSRETFQMVSSDIESVESELETLESSALTIREADSLTDLELGDGYGVESDLYPLHAEMVEELLAWYQDKHPRRRKIPLSRIAEEYGDHDEVQAITDQHNDRLDHLQDKRRNLRSDKREVSESIDLREGDEPVTWLSVANQGESRLVARAALEALYVDHHWGDIPVEWETIESDKSYSSRTDRVEVRVYIHPGDVEIAAWRTFCGDGEAFTHHCMRHHKGTAARDYDSVKVDFGGLAVDHLEHDVVRDVSATAPKLITISEESEEMDTYDSLTPRFVQVKYGYSREEACEEFRNHRKHPPPQEMSGDEWFLRDPKDLRAT